MRTFFKLLLMAFAVYVGWQVVSAPGAPPWRAVVGSPPAPPRLRRAVTVKPTPSAPPRRRAPTRSAPSVPGYFGATYQDAPADWTVSGCELLDVSPGSPAALAGLVGAVNRFDPVGDVIYEAVVRGVPRPIPNCTVLSTVLAETTPGETLPLSYYHRVVDLFFGHWQARSTTVTLTAAPCPPPLSGRMTGPWSGNRIALTVRVVGPAGTRTMTAIFDTGGVQPTFPDAVLRQVGYQPQGETFVGGVVPGAWTNSYVYQIPGQALQVLDNGRFVPLATGSLQVMGVPQLGFVFIGPSILRQGASIATAGATWTLQPPCLLP
jgi:hypothetical protein